MHHDHDATDISFNTKHIVLLSAILFYSAGYNGHDCLLRAICEAAEIPLGLHNGVLGDIMHIILTYAIYFCLSFSRRKGTIECNNGISINFFSRYRPSSSANENILYDFYDAEAHGTLNMCHLYSKNCPESILDWISLLE